MNKTTALIATLPPWAQEHLAAVKHERDMARLRAERAEYSVRSTGLELDLTRRRLAMLEARRG